MGGERGDPATTNDSPALGETEVRKVYEYSHLEGAEILLVRYPEINDEIDEVFAK